MRRVLALLCVFLAAGCATQGGVEVAGRASQVSPPPSPPSLPSGTPASADPVAVLRADPLINPKVKTELAPCEDGHYPIDDRYVDITGDGKAELLVTLRGCWTDILAKAGAPYESGYAGYVYNLATDPPANLLGVEGGAVDFVPYAGRGGDLVLIRSSWSPSDDPCCPSDQVVVSYRWDGTKLLEVPN